ncbi:hypothetical protein [Blastococcus sp. CCUG 61487]|uniref:hypothetical protein n=1 Tax=Blastococcus sp. CCUG 61487 TaxID=1840703 RepID=UPI0010C14DB9|nr:hypothetical protein [Blastococcus sp. CCUG 61487]TKJ18658.1 hypothetical protein A6V29_11365 [Blastococcus sp. CCUG 61487]
MSGGLGPILVVAVVLAGLALLTRWAFGPGYGRGTPPAERSDDGLLVPVATVSSPETARALRAVLSDAGIRSTQRTHPSRRTDVLVFPDDAARAGTLAAGFGG